MREQHTARIADNCGSIWKLPIRTRLELGEKNSELMEVLIEAKSPHHISRFNIIKFFIYLYYYYHESDLIEFNSTSILFWFDLEFSSWK